MLVIVPARGGSKGVPQKNLRTVEGKPLVLRALDVVRAASADRWVAETMEPWRIVCSTDDPTIAAVARAHGYEVHRRPLSSDRETVQELAGAVVEELAWGGITLVVQPTSATLTPATILMALSEFARNSQLDSLSSVVAEDRMLRGHEGEPLTAHVNRQWRDPLWRETGGIQLARTMPARGADPRTPLVGELHQTFELTLDEGLDVDDRYELATARMLLGRRRITFVVVASDTLGTGHLRRCLALAQELDHHTIRFSVHGDGFGTPAAESPPEWALAEVERAGYVHGPDGILSDLVVFDCLDTSVELVASVKGDGAAVLCLEDLGPGAQLADVVVNELYRAQQPNELIGSRFAVLRPEFMALPDFVVRDKPEQILVSFGGTDPAKLTERCLDAVAGLGIAPYLVGGEDVMVECMLESDLLLTSAGRTVHEAAAVGLPTITIAANQRETLHLHAPGAIHLGLHATVSDDAIRGAVTELARSPHLRSELSTRGRAAVDGKGARRIAHMVEGLLEGL